MHTTAKKRLKKGVYVFLFMVLGLLVQFIVHALLESLILMALVTNFDRYGLGLSWSAWWHIHTVGSFVLLGAGIVIGWHQGNKRWRIIYHTH